MLSNTYGRYTTVVNGKMQNLKILQSGRLLRVLKFRHAWDNLRPQNQIHGASKGQHIASEGANSHPLK